MIALFTPFAVYLRDLSLGDPQRYAEAGCLLESLPVKGSLALFAWALAHHALAGVRHLLMDIDAGSSFAVARRSAWVVNVAGLAVAVVALRILI